MLLQILRSVWSRPARPASTTTHTATSGTADQTVKGTRPFHSVKCVERGMIMSRHLSCTCKPCLSGVRACNFLDVVGPWSSQGMRRPGRQQRRPQAAPEVTPSSSTVTNEGPNQWRLSQTGRHYKRMSQ